MANLRRRSARLSKTSTNQLSARETPASGAQLGSLVERDETPDTAEQSIDGIIATPTTSRTIAQLSQLSALRTPQTEPRPAQAEMNPKTAHRSTTKAPDSGLKLGFSDIRTDKRFDTPSKSTTRQHISTSPTFEFKFSADSELSKDAQRLMDNVREDAARIKAQMIAEKATQDEKDKEAETMFGASRKIAQPRGKAGRFSEVHMAQFKKMDSIENHASAFRARPGFAAPTTQSLKRSPSKAGLDELNRSKAALGSAATRMKRVSPPITGRPNSTSPFKSIPTSSSRSTQGPAKRIRQSQYHDVSDSRLTNAVANSRPSTLYSPTKSSTARLSKITASPQKPSMIPRSNSTRSIKSIKSDEAAATAADPPVPLSSHKPLPPLPVNSEEPLYPTLPQSPTKSLSAIAREGKYTSKLPTLSGLKSILRGNRKTTEISERPGTPKRPNTATIDSDSPKKVDFTPSVKSRHAVKLSVGSPSPAKIRRNVPYKASEPVIPYDSSAYIIREDEDQDWEDEDSEITYPSLPPTEDSGSAIRAFETKAKEFNRRESKEFKSIFTNLHPSRSDEPATLTSINTTVNKTNPENHATKWSAGHTNVKPSPSTIRRVRTSGTTQLVQPFEDRISTVQHGLPGKKRRHESPHEEDKHGFSEGAKENRQASEILTIPGGWNEDETEFESSTRMSKRVRMSTVQPKEAVEKSPVKKPSAAREAAAKNAKERKGKGVLSLSRLNMLSRPKSRG